MAWVATVVFPTDCTLFCSSLLHSHQVLPLCTWAGSPGNVSWWSLISASIKFDVCVYCNASLRVSANLEFHKWWIQFLPWPDTQYFFIKLRPHTLCFTHNTHETTRVGRDPLDKIKPSSKMALLLPLPVSLELVLKCHGCNFHKFMGHQSLQTT